MMTPAESHRLKEIKALVKEGRVDLVSAEEKQWVLNLLKREQVSVRKEAMDLAAAGGYDVSGIKTM